MFKNNILKYENVLHFFVSNICKITLFWAWTFDRNKHDYEHVIRGFGDCDEHV